MTEIEQVEGTCDKCGPSTRAKVRVGKGFWRLEFCNSCFGRLHDTLTRQGFQRKSEEKGATS